MGIRVSYLGLKCPHKEADAGIKAVVGLEGCMGTYLEMKSKIKRVKSMNASVFWDGEDKKRTHLWHIYITTNSGKTLSSRITATFKKKNENRALDKVFWNSCNDAISNQHIMSWNGMPDETQ